MALVRAVDISPAAFAQVLREMDTAEVRRTVLRLVYLLQDAYGGADQFAEFVETLQTVGGQP